MENTENNLWVKDSTAFGVNKPPRRVVSVCPCAGAGEAVYADDGAVFYTLPNGNLPRTYVEGVPVPGTARAVEIGTQLSDVPEWEAVARNLAQVLTNTAAWLDEFAEGKAGDTMPVDTAQLRSAFKGQCEAHGVVA